MTGVTMSGLSKIVGILAATAPFTASVCLDRHWGYAVGTALWALMVLSWVYERPQKRAE